MEGEGGGEEGVSEGCVASATGTGRAHYWVAPLPL